MKKDEIYPSYITYLNNRLNENKISKGSFALLKMSRDSFNDFKYKYENDDKFKNQIDDLERSEIRDKRIDDIFDDL
jgi:hypothetical protein